VVEQYPEDVKVVFKHFPLPNHKQAMPAARASIAAQRQGKFWPFHDGLFQGKNRLSEQGLTALARELGLDMKRFDKDRKERASQQLVQRDMQQGRAAGLRGTPAIYVNGVPLERAGSGALQKAIERELERLKQQ
jgi:protein-disulfide isomerase